MTRSSDLDTVAPDDVIENKKEEEVKTVNLKEKIYDIVGHTKHSLSSVLVNPDIFNFEERDNEEEILLVARPHQ